MGDVFKVVLPTGISKDEIVSLEAELNDIDVVEDAGRASSRAFDAASATLSIRVEGGMLDLVGTAVPLLNKVLDTIRGRGIKGARITMPNGTTVEADEISVRGLEALVRVARSEEKE